MNKKIQKIILFLGIIFIFFLGYPLGHNFVSSATTNNLEVIYPTVFGLSLNNNSSFADFVCYFIALLTNLAFFIAVLTIVFGGVYYLVSYGRGKFTSDAKDWIKAGILGLLIVVCAYLIAYTINPDLNTCKPFIFPEINFNPSTNTATPPGVDVYTYKEIPLGILTENLLTRTMNCFEFDPYGDPIDGKPSTQNILEPSYVNHDRADCIMQLWDGAKKKAQLVASLTDEITKLMNQCSCRIKDEQGNDTDASKCDPTCDPATGCQLTACPGGTCDGECVEGDCKQPPDTKDCCPTDSGFKNSQGEIISVKDQIEHGPIPIIPCPGQIVGDPDFNSPSFKNPANIPPGQCIVGSVLNSDATIKSAIDIAIGPGVSLGMVQEAVDEWNALTPYPIFGDILLPGDEGYEEAKGKITIGDTAAFTGNYNAVGGCKPYISGQEITGFEIVLTDKSEFYINLDDILMHEMGHAVGLADAYDTRTGQTNPNCMDSVMNDPFTQTTPGAPDTKKVDLLYVGQGPYEDLGPDPFADIFPPTGEGNFESIGWAAADSGGYRGLDEFRCGGECGCSNISQCVENNQGFINKTKWSKLTLYQQLIYFMEKKEQIKQLIQADENELEKARSELANCYLAMPYVDLVKTYENADKTEKIILKDPETFIDTGTNTPIDASKYCAGFNYNNSSCYKKCNDYAPDWESRTMECYKACGTCEAGDTACQINLSGCIENCWNYRRVIYGPDTSQFYYFDNIVVSTYPAVEPNTGHNDCVSKCQNDCINDCKLKYLQCEDEYSICFSRCINNGVCVMAYDDQCLFNNNHYAECANNITDEGNSFYCIRDSYLCKNGSEQYAGYPDCIQPSSLNCSSFNNPKTCIDSEECSWDIQSNICYRNYSADFILKKKLNSQDIQKCPSPILNPAESDSICYSTISPQAPCIYNCPESTKCPASSNCPGCVCDAIQNTWSWTMPKQSMTSAQTCANDYDCSLDDVCRSGICKPSVTCTQGSDCLLNEFCLNKVCVPTNYDSEVRQIQAYQIVGPECNEYSYNDDPLNFYCQDNWWTDITRQGLNQKPIGTDRICPKQGEVPVGRTVDDAKEWADWIKNVADATITKDIQDMLTQMEKIGKAKETNPIQDYCKCNAKMEDNSSICTTNCQYWESQSCDEYGNCWWNCGCNFLSCKGSPCQQVKDYLSELWNIHKQFKVDFIDYHVSMMTEPRSDIMKELTYSRQSISNCSLVNTTYKADTRLFSCTRVKDEIILPFNKGQVIFKGQTVLNAGKLTYTGLTADVGCYGQSLGQAIGRSLTDNWFCCEEYAQNPTAGNNPIYKTQK